MVGRRRFVPAAMLGLAVFGLVALGLAVLWTFGKGEQAADWRDWERESALGLSFAMPDPLKVSEGNSDFARKLRTHKVLRWVTFAGMLAQIGLGVVSANSEWFGLDRANDYKALRGIATAHMAVSLVTYGAMTWAGAIMIF